MSVHQRPRSWVRVLSSLLGAALLVLVAAPAADAASIRYVALGDSYSSGVGAGDYVADSGDCLRSRHAYPALWADAHEVASFVFAACSGATTADVLTNQLDRLSERTTLVTVSVGGNDAGFADVMTTCVLHTEQTCIDRVARAEEFARTELPSRLGELYTAIRDQAPEADLVVLGYPRMYELHGSCWVGLSEAERAAVNSGADALAEVTAKAAAEAGATFVDVRDVFAGHEICSADWWLHSVNWWNLVESYHPTAQGQSQGYLAALTAVTDRSAATLTTGHRS